MFDKIAKNSQITDGKISRTEFEQWRGGKSVNTRFLIKS
ncbi:hypothetical protein EC836_101931 [Erwinia sp. JUb26]|nr:hypothetical protein EC836_101931 [Erwinia sp. JUb26]